MLGFLVQFTCRFDSHGDVIITSQESAADFDLYTWHLWPLINRNSLACINNGHFWGPVTLTSVTEHLAVELSVTSLFEWLKYVATWIRTLQLGNVEENICAVSLIRYAILNLQTTVVTSSSSTILRFLFSSLQWSFFFILRILTSYVVVPLSLFTHVHDSPARLLSLSQHVHDSPDRLLSLSFYKHTMSVN